MATITRKSIRQGDDFKILITFKDRDGAALEATPQQFKFVYRDIYGESYEISYDGTKRTHCYVENGHLIGVFEDYKLACCVLKREAWYWVADPAFSDGKWDHGNTVLSGIELTRDGGTREVEEEAEVSGTICVNETLAISKGDKGDPFVYEDFTPEQLEALRGATGGQGIQGFRGADGGDGEDGKSAYQLAVEAGYAGTEAQFKTEQANIANNSARLTTVEQNKANLVDGYVPSQEINPLQGKQTGVQVGLGRYYNKTFPSNITQHVSTSSLSFEFFIEYDGSQPTTVNAQRLCAITDNYGSDIASARCYPNGYITLSMSNRRSDGTRETITAPVVKLAGNIHIVLTLDRVNKLFVCYLNGGYFWSAPFVQSISNIEYSSILLGDTNVASKSFIIRHSRIFNKALTQQEMIALWNGGHPEEYRLIDKRSLFAEYIPEYLSLMGWKDSSDNGIDLAATGNVALSYGCKYSGSPMTPLFMARGAVWNASTGYYELNGLTDITEEQMTNIYTKTSPISCGLSQISSNFLYLDSNITTNFLPLNGNGFTPWDAGVYSPTSARAMFRGCRQLKVANIGEVLSANNITYLFLGDAIIQKVLGVLDVSGVLSNAVNTTLAFSQCYLLEGINIKGLKASLTFADCAKLTRDSIVYLITNAANTSPITVTLHAEAKARLTPEDIALASSKNITIA